MKLEFYRPRNKILQKYIEGYYFIGKSERITPLNYITFPNNYTILSINQNSEVFYGKDRITVTPSVETRISANLVFRYINPIEVCYEGPGNEITFYFKPLGLNNFLTNDLSFFSLKHNLPVYFPFKDFEAKMKEVFALESREMQIKCLEGYWISKLSEKDFTLVEQILMDIEQDVKITAIANKYHLSRQYVNRLFVNNIGKTPTEYRKIHRFRNSILKHNPSKNLTRLSHESLFYDQSHFIKDFKELSHLIPSTFFKTVDTEKENVWLFL